MGNFITRMQTPSQDITHKLSLLVRLAVADKHFAGLEKDVIMRIGRAQGLSDAAIDRIIRFPMPLKTPNSAGNEEKLVFLKDCLDLIRADRRVLESEVIFFRSIAIRLGFAREMVDRLLALPAGEPINGPIS